MRKEKLTEKQALWKVFEEMSDDQKLRRALPYLHGRLEGTEEGRKFLREAYQIETQETEKTT